MAEALHSDTPRTGLSAVLRKLMRGGGGEFVLFAGSTLLFQGSRLAVSLVAAAWVGPERFGVWNILNLLLLYGALVSLGVPNGMNREVPLQRGRGDELGARRIADESFWFTLITTLIGGMLIFGAAFGGFAPQGDAGALIWAAALFVCWQLYQYLQIRLKSRGHFGQMSIQQIIFALLFPVLVLPATSWWGIQGFVAGQALVVLLVCAYLIRRDPPRRVGWNWPQLRGLIRIGGPIMLAGMLYSLLTTVDRWVIVNRLGVEALGHYSLAILCVGTLSLFPAIIAQQMYPRMAFRFGQTGRKADLGALVVQQSLLATAVTVPFIAGVYLLLPFVVQYLMPAYAPGLEAARIALFGLACVPLGGGMANFLNTVNKQGYYLLVQAGAIGVSLLLSTAFVGMGWGLNGVAAGAAITYGLYSLALIGVGLLVYRAKGSG